MDKLNREKTSEASEYKVVMNNLKRLLKAKKITYSEIAKGIGMSESGVKKFFSAHDGSFHRISQVCHFLGVSMGELIDDRQTFEVDFSEKQQREFLKDPNLFHFYWLLAYERRSVDVVQKILKLNRIETLKMSRRLDLLGLIQLLPGGRLGLPAIRAVRWKGKGDFVRDLYRRWTRALLDDVMFRFFSENESPKKGHIANKSNEDISDEKFSNETKDFFMVRYLQMTKRTYAEFIAAQASLEEEFVRRAIHEMRSFPGDVKHVRWLTAIDQRSFVTHEEASQAAKSITQIDR